MVVSVITTQELHRKYRDSFPGIGCFKGTFFLAGQRKQEIIPGTAHTCGI